MLRTWSVAELARGLLQRGGRLRRTDAKRCWSWRVGDTERLDRKRIGDKVRVRFDLRKTDPETRTVTLRRAPPGLADVPHNWYRHPDVKLRLSWIGCDI